MTTGIAWFWRPDGASVVAEQGRPQSCGERLRQVHGPYAPASAAEEHRWCTGADGTEACNRTASTHDTARCAAASGPLCPAAAGHRTTAGAPPCSCSHHQVAGCDAACSSCSSAPQHTAADTSTAPDGSPRSTAGHTTSSGSSNSGTGGDQGCQRRHRPQSPIRRRRCHLACSPLAPLATWWLTALLAALAGGPLRGLGPAPAAAQYTAVLDLYSLPGSFDLMSDCPTLLYDIMMQLPYRCVYVGVGGMARVGVRRACVWWGRGWLWGAQQGMRKLQNGTDAWVCLRTSEPHSADGLHCIPY